MENRSTVGGDYGKVPEDRHDLINLVVGAFRSIRAPIAYVSMPISSGKLMYDVLESKGVRTIEDLARVDPDSLYRDIVAPNIEMGVAAADRVRSSLPPIAPSVFEGKKFRWTQEEYMALWFRVIEEKAREMHMTDGWEYSNGGVEEFTRATEMQFGLIDPFLDNSNFPFEADKKQAYERMKEMTLYDLGGKEIRVNDGISMVADAIVDIKGRGFETERLVESFNQLCGVVLRWEDPFSSVCDRDHYTGGKMSLPYEISGKVTKARLKQVRSLK